jgi:hypothetical protein
MKKVSAKKNYLCKRPWRPIRLWDVRLPHFLDNPLTDNGEVVSLRRRQAALYPQ